MMNATVSVIVPTWNRKYLLMEAIQSVLMQTNSVLEVLICDDGSTDGSVLTARTSADARVHWIESSHSGLPAVPRNNGLRKARGDWIAFLDSDDEWQPAKIETQLRELEAAGTLASCTNAIHFLPGTGREGNLLCYDKNRIDFKQLLRNNQVVTSSSLVHRSIIEKCGFFPEDEPLRGLEDYSYCLRVATQTEFAYLHEPLVIYRDNPSHSIRSKEMDNVEWRQKLKVMRNFMQWAKSTSDIVDPHFYGMANREYRQLRLNYQLRLRGLKLLLRKASRRTLGFHQTIM